MDHEIPSVCDVLLVDSTRYDCELHRRLEGDRWLTELYANVVFEPEI